MKPRHDRRDHAPRILAGRFKGRPLAVPAGRATRPLRVLVRRSLFDILGPVLDGARVLDLFAGAGSVGFEALSRGAAHVTLVDAGRDARDAQEETVAAWGCADAVRILAGPAERFVRDPDAGRFDFVFVGAPYPLFAARDAEPLRSVWAHVGRRLAPGGVLVVESPGPTALPVIAAVSLVDSRIYGETTLSFFRPDGAQAEPPGGR